MISDTNIIIIFVITKFIMNKTNLIDLNHFIMGNYIYEARRLAGKTQLEAATALGLKQTTYSTKEQKLKFSRVEMSKLIAFIGQYFIDQAKSVDITSLVNEDEVSYGKGGSQYRQLLTSINEIKSLQKSCIIIQAEVYADLKGKPVDIILREFKKKIEQKTGKEFDL